MPETEDHAATGEVVDRRHALGEHGRAVQRRDDDGGPELHRLGHRGDIGERVKGIRHWVRARRGPGTRRNLAALGVRVLRVVVVCEDDVLDTPNRLDLALLHHGYPLAKEITGGDLPRRQREQYTDDRPISHARI
jgi:hypothetical protein